MPLFLRGVYVPLYRSGCICPYRTEVLPYGRRYAISSLDTRPYEGQMNNISRNLSPRILPDVRVDTFPVFIFSILQSYPVWWGKISPHDPHVSTLYLTADLGLPASQRATLCQHAGSAYGLSWCELFHARVRRHDITIGEIHRRLWHTANMQCAREDRQPYRRRR